MIRRAMIKTKIKIKQKMIILFFILLFIAIMLYCIPFAKTAGFNLRVSKNSKFASKTADFSPQAVY